MVEVVVLIDRLVLLLFQHQASLLIRPIPVGLVLPNLDLWIIRILLTCEAGMSMLQDEQKVLALILFISMQG